MTEQEAIEDLKHENEQCLSLCEAACASIKEYQCNCRDSVIERMIDELLQYRKIGTVEECRKAVEQNEKNPDVDCMECSTRTVSTDSAWMGARSKRKIDDENNA